jgi:integrase
VRYWYQDLASRYQTTADDAYRLLRVIVNTALVDGHVAKSPMTVKGAGSVRSVERPIASIPEVGALVAAIPTRYRAPLLMAAWCQLRRGELLGIQRRHVDLMHGSVRIEQAWVVPLGERAVLDGVKTDASKSTLTIPANVLPFVAEHLSRFVSPEPEAWFCAVESGAPMAPRNLNRAWAKARAKIARPDLHLHDLRHSGLTWAAVTGATTKELMRRGGHSSPRAALRYQHATQERDEALAKALAELAIADVVPIRKSEAE